jgi:hypothetical protein
MVFGGYIFIFAARHLFRGDWLLDWLNVVPTVSFQAAGGAAAIIGECWLFKISAN